MAGSSRGRRTYARDNRGRFASTGTTTAKAKPAARRAQRGTNRITRDNSGRITGVGKNGATARGGRLRTAAGNQRGAVLDRLKRAPMAGTVGRGGKVRGGVKPVARPATPAKPARATVNGASQAKARLQRAMDNYDKKKYAVVQAEARLKKAKSPKASKALGKANKSLMTASQAVKYLKGNMNSDTLRMGSRYRAGNRDNVAATYSVKRVAGAFRSGKSRLVAPPKGTRMGRAIPGSGGQIKATAKAARPSGTIRKPQGLKPGAIAARKAKPQKSVKLTASQRSAAQRARDTFNDPTLLLNGRIAKGYKEGIQAIQQKFGVNNRIATLAFMRRAFRMGTSDIQYIDTARTKKTIKALRARTAIGSPIGGSSRKAKAPAIPGTVSRGRRKMATAKLAAPKQAKAARTAAKPARGKRKARVDDGRVSRVIDRLNNVVRGAEQKTGVKRLNAIQVGTRAKSFLARKEGGSVGMLNQMSQPEAFASVRKAMTKPPRYSTQKPNRNKPGRFNDLGQDKARIKARRDAMTARDRIQEGNQSAAAKAKAQRPKLSRDAIRGGAWSRRELGYSTSRKGFARAARIKGTVPKPKREAKVSTTVARTRSQARASQRRRREITLNRVRTGVYGIGIMRKNPRIRAVDTGMSQLALVGKPKKLKRYKPVK